MGNVNMLKGEMLICCSISVGSRVSVVDLIIPLWHVKVIASLGFIFAPT